MGRPGGPRARQAHHRVRLQETTDRGFGKGGTGVLSVDGRQVDSKKMPYSIPFLVSMDESFDVGVDTRYGVDDNDYQPPFRFTGKLNKLTIQLVPPERTAEEEDFLRKKDTRGQQREALTEIRVELTVMAETAEGARLVEEAT